MRPALSILITLWGTLAFGQSQRSKPIAHSVDPERIHAAISAARGTPAEFDADALLTLVESGLIPARERRDLLEEAYSVARSAQETIAQKGNEGGLLAYALHSAFFWGLDRVTLRARTSKAMLALDQKRAVEMFRQIDLPFDLELTCDQQFSYDLTMYYGAMQDILNSINDPELAEVVLQEHLARFRSSAQVTPLAKVLMTARIDSSTLARATDTFSDRLAKLDQDTTVFYLHYEKALYTLQALAAKLALPARERLLQNARLWALRGYAHGMCTHRQRYEQPPGGQKKPILWLNPIEGFNTLLAPNAASPASFVIEPKDIPASPAGDAVLQFKDSEDWKRLSRQRTLLAQETEEAKDSPRWKSEMEKYITLVSEWKMDGDDPSVFFLEKCDLFNRLLSIQRSFVMPENSSPKAIESYYKRLGATPNADILGRERIISNLVQFLDSAAGQKVYEKRRAVWFGTARELLGSYGSSADVQAIASVYKYARSPVLNLYGNLAQLVRESRN